MEPIHLTEYQTSPPILLTRSEVSQLLSTGLVDIKPLPSEGEYELKAKSIVGTVILPSLRLLIRPKVGLKNLFYLLGYGAVLTSWAEEQFPYEREPDLLRAIAWIFEAEVSRAVGQGLVRGYQPRSETLTTIRGRIDMAGQIRVRQGRPFPLECSFEEYTEDIELNRIIKAAFRRLLQVPRLDRRIVQRMRFRYRTFDEVASVPYGPRAVPKIRFTRLNQHWLAATELARLILEQGSLRDETGKILGISFTIDMNQLFERFIEKIVGDEARRAGWQFVSQDQRPFADGISVIPDLLLRSADRDFAVGDAKYKDLDKQGPRTDDLYQLLAYCVSLGLPAGLLFYAGKRPLEQYVIRRTGITLEAIGIDMTGTPSEVETQARNAAKRLIRQAYDARRERGDAPGNLAAS